MKKYLKILLFVIIGCFLFNFCTRYDEGGYYSAHRLCKTWVLTSTKDSDLSYPDALLKNASNLEITFVRGGYIQGGGVEGTVKINGVKLSKNVSFRTTKKVRERTGYHISTQDKINFLEISNQFEFSSYNEISWCYFQIKELTNSTLTLDCYVATNYVSDDGFTTYFVGGQTYKFKAKK